jgi:hypothetical protein
MPWINNVSFTLATGLFQTTLTLNVFSFRLRHWSQKIFHSKNLFDYFSFYRLAQLRHCWFWEETFWKYYGAILKESVREYSTLK